MTREELRESARQLEILRYHIRKTECNSTFPVNLKDFTESIENGIFALEMLDGQHPSVLDRIAKQVVECL